MSARGGFTEPTRAFFCPAIHDEANIVGAGVSPARQ